MEFLPLPHLILACAGGKTNGEVAAALHVAEATGEHAQGHCLIRIHAIRLQKSCTYLAKSEPTFRENFIVGMIIL
jgi:hypothetical protein